MEICNQCQNSDKMVDENNAAISLYSDKSPTRDVKLSLRNHSSPSRQLPVARKHSPRSVSPTRNLINRSSSPHRIGHNLTVQTEKYLSYADFIKVLHCLSLNIVSRVIDSVSENFAEKKMSPLLHIMNMSSGREKMTNSRRVAGIVPPFRLASVVTRETSPSRLSTSPKRCNVVTDGSPVITASFSAKSKRAYSPTKGKRPQSPTKGPPRRVYNATTPRPTGAAKSLNKVLDKKQPKKEEPPDFQF